MTTSHFYHGATEDSCINSKKNGWFGHKSQMCGLEWIEFLVLLVVIEFKMTIVKSCKSIVIEVEVTIEVKMTTISSKIVMIWLINSYNYLELQEGILVQS